MSQFDIFKNKGQKAIPFVLDIQADVPSTVLGTRIVVPLYLRDEVENPVTTLHIPFTIAGKKVIALFDEMGAVAAKSLGEPAGRLSKSYWLACGEAIEMLLFDRVVSFVGDE